MARESLKLGKKFEDTVPFALGVLCSGRMLYTAGITARDADGKIVGKGDMRAQVVQCLANLSDILSAAGGSWDDVVKYTFFTTDIARFNGVGRELWGPYFLSRPASTLVEVRKLLDPDMLIEIEVIACLGSGSGSDVGRDAISELPSR